MTIGLVECLPYKRVSNTCRYTFKDLIEVFKSSAKTIKYEYNLDEVEIEIKNYDFSDSAISREDVRAFSEISNTDIINDSKYNGLFDVIRVNILIIIKEVYSFVNKYIFYLSIIMYFIVLFKFIKHPKELYEEILMLTGIFCLYYCRIFIVTFTSNMMWTSAINTMYMASAYPLQFIFSALSILWGTNILKEVIKNRRKK